MEASTTAGTTAPTTWKEVFTHPVTQSFTEHFTQSSGAGVLTTTSAQTTETISDAFVEITETTLGAFEVLATISAQMTETISDPFVGVLATTSAEITETTSEAFLVGATIVDDGSFETIFGEFIFALLLVLLLAILLVLVLRYIAKHKGTYHTNEAECGDSVDTYGGASQSELVQLEILNEEE